MIKREEAALRFDATEKLILSKIANTDCTYINCPNCECFIKYGGYTMCIKSAIASIPGIADVNN